MVEISTSVLSVDEEKAITTFYNLEVAGTDYFHIDVMDGKFVKKDTTKKMLKYAEYIKHISNLPLDVHLMVEDVKAYVDSFISLEPDRITFHLEAIRKKEEIMQMIKYIKENGIKVSIAIKPNTKIEEIYPYLPYINMVLIMTVEPGEGGQVLIEGTINKINKIKQYINENNLETVIEADGGINPENINSLKNAGIDIAVVGTAIINSNNFKETMKKLKK